MEMGDDNDDLFLKMVLNTSFSFGWRKSKSGSLIDPGAEVALWSLKMHVNRDAVFRGWIRTILTEGGILFSESIGS